MGWHDAARARVRLLFSRRAAESRMNDEIRLHVELEAEHLMRTKGLAAGEAQRQALMAFGGIEAHKDTMRDGRGLAWCDRFSLDVKLAARLLVRYPLLTLVATAGMAFGIAAGVGGFEIRAQLVSPSIPLDEGDRIVGVRNWNASRFQVGTTTPVDFESWRSELSTITDLSATRLFERNLLTDDGRSEIVALAAMTASAFRVARVQPLLGRALGEADERAGAPAVIVLGHRIWQDRFSSDANVIGHTVRIDGERTTIVGVMPDGFAFPSAHDVWTPLRIDPSASTTTDVPALLVFGRLAEHVTVQQAQAELTTVGLRAQLGSSPQRDHIRPEVVAYTRLFFDSLDVRIGVAIGNIFLVMLMLLVCADVGLLMFARASRREGEIAVRSALGAGRPRIIAQLFIEALVLTVIAAGVGLVVAQAGLRWFLAVIEADSGRRLPFWAGAGLTPRTVAYAVILTLVCAAIVGVFPALKITGRRGTSSLRESGRGGGFRFGGVWTAVIATQVAVTLMFPAAAFIFHRQVVRSQNRDFGFPADRYLSARIELDRYDASGAPVATAPGDADRRLPAILGEVERRLLEEPEVAGVTYTDTLPGTRHRSEPIELDGEADAGAGRQAVASAFVAVNFFDVLGATALAGRTFTAADAASNVVVVNRSFVDEILGGRNAVGRRIRPGVLDDSRSPGPWLEIVGVVPDLGMSGPSDTQAGTYRPVSPERAAALRLAVHVRTSPESFASRFRAIAGDVEPALRVHALMPLVAAGSSEWSSFDYLSRLVVVFSAVALLLSLSTIYSVMAFTVSRRTREIGIRVTLGANRPDVVAVVLRRPLTQVAGGVLLGGVLVALTFIALYETTPRPIELAVIAGYSIGMMGVCLLACVVPTRRALAVQPAEVLRADA
jgi:putative ABC transport system permease protein